MSAPPVLLPPSWGEVLDRIQASIEDVLRTSGTDLPALAPAQALPQWATEMERIDERLAALGQACARAEQAATEADAALGLASRELEDWARAARSLATPAGGAVS